jgi:hypothetical protein
MEEGWGEGNGHDGSELRSMGVTGAMTVNGTEAGSPCGRERIKEVCP